MSQARQAHRRALGVAASLAATAAAILVAITFAATASTAATCNGYVGLTYDDGPNAGTTNSLLNALRTAGVRATFFNIGQNAQANQSLSLAEKNAGMWLGNHSWTHPHMTQLSTAQMTSEISQTQQVLTQTTGAAPKLFRPPFGETNATLRSVEAQFGLTEVLWDVDSQDWNGASTAAIVSAAGRLTNGQVILMHEGFQTTIQAVPQIVAGLTSRNLCAGMISPTTGRAVAPDGTPTPTATASTRPTTPPPTTPAATTPAATTPAATTPPAGGGTCRVVSVIQAWNTGLTNNMTITNTGGATINGWRLTFTLPSGQSIVSGWNATYSPTSGAITATNMSYNATIAPSGSVSIGYQANHTGNSGAPTNVALNGTACATS